MSMMVVPLGLEPRTPGLSSQYSNQLSYETTLDNLSSRSTVGPRGQQLLSFQRPLLPCQGRSALSLSDSVAENKALRGFQSGPNGTTAIRMGPSGTTDRSAA